MTGTGALPRILLVDDEPHVLAALRRQLGRRFEVVTANGGAEALAAIDSGPPFPVVVSDLRMPCLSGIELLREVRRRSPDTVRVLLTGQGDLAAAILAVNEGQVFRFLTKPCPPPVLDAAIAAAQEQHRLITAERVLLEQTLHGSIRVLVDILALADPSAFGRATRLKRLVSELAEHASIGERWPVEVAAMLCQLGRITLPQATVARLQRGEPLAPEEQEMVDRLPGIAERLIANIPRLEPVCRILAAAHGEAGGAAAPWGARALRLALDYDALESRGLVAEQALQAMRQRDPGYDPELFASFAALRVQGEVGSRPRRMGLMDLTAGMVLAADVKTTTGILLVARGQEVTESLLERLHNVGRLRAVREPILVVPAGAAPPGEAVEAAEREALASAVPAASR